jgi:hypothetical protein
MGKEKIASLKVRTFHFLNAWYICSIQFNLFNINHSYNRNSWTSHILTFIVSNPVELMPSGLKIVSLIVLNSLLKVSLQKSKHSLKILLVILRVLFLSPYFHFCSYFNGYILTMFLCYLYHWAKLDNETAEYYLAWINKGVQIYCYSGRIILFAIANMLLLYFLHFHLH